MSYKNGPSKTGDKDTIVYSLLCIRVGSSGGWGKRTKESRQNRRETAKPVIMLMGREFEVRGNTIARTLDNPPIRDRSSGVGRSLTPELILQLSKPG